MIKYTTLEERKGRPKTISSPLSRKALETTLEERKRTKDDSSPLSKKALETPSQKEQEHDIRHLDST